MPAFLKNPALSAIRSINYKKEKYYADLFYSGFFTTKINSKAKFKMHSSGGTIEKLIFWFGVKGFEPESLVLWTYYAQNANTIMDIGANTGVYSLVSAAVNPNAKIYCFEPSDAIFNQLSSNVNANNFSNIKPNKVGISDSNGELLFYDIDSPNHTSASFLPEKIKEAEPDVKLIEHKVSVVTLDSFVTDNNIPSVDLVKIDVELFEKNVFDGAKATIEKYKPVIFFEVLTDKVAADLQPLLGDYTVYHLELANGKPNIVKTDKLFVGKNGCWNFLALPAGKTLNVDDFYAFYNAVN